MSFKIFPIKFSSEKWAQAIEVYENALAKEILSSLELRNAQAVITVAGGASGMTTKEQTLLYPLFVEGLAYFASKEHVAIFDGGSDSGVMKLTGYGRVQVLASGMQDFPLIGVSPVAIVRWPGHDSVRAQVDLEPNHSHFVLIPGDHFGPEDKFICDLATELGKHMPSAALIVNGGSITLDDALLNTLEGRPMIVIKGSGRAADEIANAMEGSISDPRIIEIIRHGKITLFDINERTEVFQTCLRQVLFST